MSKKRLTRVVVDVPALVKWLRPRVNEIAAMVPMPTTGDPGPLVSVRLVDHHRDAWTLDLEDVLRLHTVGRHDHARDLFTSVMEGLDEVTNYKGIPPGLLTPELLSLLWNAGLARRPPRPSRSTKVPSPIDAGPHVEAVLLRVADATIGAGHRSLEGLSGVDVVAAATSGSVDGLDAVTGLCGTAALFFNGDQHARAFDFLRTALEHGPGEKLPMLVSAIVWFGLLNKAILHPHRLAAGEGPHCSNLLAVLGGALDWFEAGNPGRTRNAVVRS